MFSNHRVVQFAADGRGGGGSAGAAAASAADAADAAASATASANRAKEEEEEEEEEGAIARPLNTAARCSPPQSASFVRENSCSLFFFYVLNTGFQRAR